MRSYNSHKRVLVIGLAGSKSEIVFKPLPSDDPTQRQPDISLAKQALQWEPAVALDDGLRKTIAYFRELEIAR